MRVSVSRLRHAVCFRLGTLDSTSVTDVWMKAKKVFKTLKQGPSQIGISPGARIVTYPTCVLLIDGWAKFKEGKQWRNSCAGTNGSVVSLIDLFSENDRNTPREALPKTYLWVV